MCLSAPYAKATAKVAHSVPPIPRQAPARRDQGGFTLAELLVASALIAVILTAVYTSFHSSLQLWRASDKGFAAHQQARTSLTIMTRELQSMIGGSEHLLKGNRREIEFYAISPPMDVEEGTGSHALWVRYALKPQSGPEGDELIRQEAMVQGTLPAWDPDTGEVEFGRTDLGRKKSFVLARGVEEFAISYWWTPAPFEGEGPDGRPVMRVQDPMEVEENREGWGRPQGIKLKLVLQDEFGLEEESTFSTFVVFQGPTTPLGQGLTGGPLGGRL